MPKQPTKFYLKRENGREKYPGENSKKKEMEEKIYRLKKKIKELERNLKNEKKEKKRSRIMGLMVRRHDYRKPQTLYA